VRYKYTRSGFRIALAVVALSGTATWAQGNPQFGMSAAEGYEICL
jgi:hypothetical protein